MAQIVRYIGGAGTGKTTLLLNTMSRVIEAGHDPREIGFVSFTRAARHEAARRAHQQFGCRQEELERDGWFRTLHSVCYRTLGVSSGQLLDDTADSRKWFEENLSVKVAGVSPQDGEYTETDGKNPASFALSVWSSARNRMESLRESWERVARINEAVLSFGDVRKFVERYELRKALDDRMDFTDLVAQFAGVQFSVDGPRLVTPRGDVPSLPVWFFDEQQDTSKLLDAVCRRLISTPQVKWVYVCGDPFQAIYSWAGADHRCFMGWDVDHQVIMPKSWRCPEPILNLGERCLRRCSDYFDRGIAPADHGGEIRRIESDLEDGLEFIDARDEWLVICRTNYHAQRVARQCDEEGKPWRPTRGNGGWVQPKKNEIYYALRALESGYSIHWEEWRRVVSELPVKHKGMEFLTRGTKSRWSQRGFTPEYEGLPLRELQRYGATEALQSFIGSGEWKAIFPGAARFLGAAEKYGEDVPSNPRIRIGTIHSVKGEEADNVLLLATTTATVERSKQTAEGIDEECRVEYVGVTRAKQRLVIAQESWAKDREQTMTI